MQDPTVPTNVFDLIKSEEANFANPITVAENYDWGFAQHVLQSTLYLNSKYLTGKSDDKPYRNIVLPILNMQHRATGFDVKDIQLFVDSPKDYYKSFLVRKFHEKWAREEGIDTFIDDLVESYCDYGGALIKNVNDTCPEVVPLQSIAFCDQTDMLGGPLAIKHFYSPKQLREMAGKGWKNVDEVITLSKNEKVSVPLAKGKTVKTPGKYIEVYEVHGTFPKWWLKDGKDMSVSEDDDELVDQLQIVTFYQSEDGTKTGLTLFAGPEKESIFKLVLRDKIYGRALGRGGVEELFEAQVWTNYDVIRMKGMLDIASKVIFQTADSAFANRNKTANLENGEILVTEPGTNISQINTTPVNITVFENSVREWDAHAKEIGAANESIMGENPSSGTPFKLQELVTAESHSLHEYRKGKLATFLDEVYREWIIPYLAREITKGQEFLAELDLDELQQIADSLVINEANKAIKEDVLNGLQVYPDQVDGFKARVREQFMKGGNKKFLEIFKDEFKDAPMSVYVNVVGKQRYMSKMTDSMVNIFRQLIASPGVLNDPNMQKLFSRIIESSGLNPMDFNFQTPQQTAQSQQPVSGNASQPMGNMVNQQGQ